MPPRAAFVPVLATRAVVVLRDPAARRGRRLAAAVGGGCGGGGGGGGGGGSGGGATLLRRVAMRASASKRQAEPSADPPVGTHVTPPAKKRQQHEQKQQQPVFLTFQDAVARLRQYWGDRGCVMWHPYNTEVGAGTMNPATFLRVLGPEPWAVAYDEPSVRPDDSRYGENPNRLQCHTQFQVILKPAPDCAQELVIGSYRALGIDVTARDIRFVEDNWESPALGAWGLGWEVWLDGMEITQFTYFQQAGGVSLDTVSVEITYGLERIIMALQGKTHFKDIIYAPGITYGEILMQNEIEMSKYHLDDADMARNRAWFDEYEAESLQLLEKRLPVPAYNFLLKASHTFNVLDSRGAVGVTERARYFQRMRNVARDVAQLWIERREELAFPLLSGSHQASSISRIGLFGGNIPPASPSAPSLGTQQAAVDSLGRACEFLLEIGVEELPAGDVSHAAQQVESILATILRDARLAFEHISVAATPRRLVATVSGLQTKQTDVSKRVRGPPLKAAVDADGKLTKAGLGFLRSQGISDQSKIEIDHDAGYVFVLVEEAGKDAVVVLADVLPNLLLPKVVFSRTMRWNASGVTFSRPIRWLLCMLDEVYIPFKYGDIVSGTTSRTLRREDGFSRDVQVTSALNYHPVLARQQVIISRSDRASRIRVGAAELASSIGGTIPTEHLHGALADEVTDLVENPLPLLGRFDEEFLSLPQEVLITVMKKHQRYFPVVDHSGHLLNAFITVANGDSDLVDVDAVRGGNEAVLRARYSDAAFFYKKDTESKKLSDFLPVLAGLTFQEKLGSMLDKVGRVRNATTKLAELLNLDPAETRAAEQTAGLFKADLGTLMVVEMTSLAGIMGRHYALRSEEVNVDVANAIFEATLPRFSGDQLPKSRIGAIVAIADRLDSLASLFSVGLVPKATADPFALRRAALGIVQILVAAGMPLKLDRAIESVTSSEALASSVLEFIAKRLEVYLSDQGFRPDIVKAVMAVGENAADPCLAFEAVKAMQAACDSTSEGHIVSTACEVHGRAQRLVRSVSGTADATFGPHAISASAIAIDESLFDADVERILLDSIKAAERAIKEDGTLLGRLRTVANLKEDLDNFCDGVFVSAEDPAVRSNRVTMLRRVVLLTNPVVDLTLMQV